MQRATTLRGENADQDPNAWVHVGDDLANDIVPARAVGMRTVWLEQIDEGWRASFSTMSPEEDAARKALAEQASPDLKISEISELVAVLDESKWFEVGRE
mmetsp:Transcript_19449/g.30441  ORF Transcript_19449/g.30441 Transcript_19449/m.30441 type:complete len:100 (+) Transcript_19449:1029-1328(+)